MDRRTLLALVASLPAIVAAPSEACSLALKSPRFSGLQNQQIRKLFETWWARDVEGFRSILSVVLTADGTPMDPDVARGTRAESPIPKDTLRIFDQFFIDKRTVKKTPIIVNTDAGVVVACSERDPSARLRSDCSGMPKLHLFFVRMHGLNIQSVAHLGSAETVETDKFSIWTEGSS